MSKTILIPKYEVKLLSKPKSKLRLGLFLDLEEWDKLDKKN